MARFEREAKLLASLNHPHIATIHGFEKDGATRFLVMELVEGPTLAERIASGPLPMEEALLIARQVTEGLEAAHEKAVVHRDLKPANIKLTENGDVKILDFGLAKAIEGEEPTPTDSKSPTLTRAGTQAGVLLGTAAYMSPEQARGQAVDRRTDIWAFGVVLFEMLTGRRLFSGYTVSDTLAAVLRADIDWNALPESTPSSVRRLLRRCLERDRKKAPRLRGRRSTRDRRRARRAGGARVACGAVSGTPRRDDALRHPRDARPRRALAFARAGNNERSLSAERSDARGFGSTNVGRGVLTERPRARVRGRRRAQQPTLPALTRFPGSSRHSWHRGREPTFVFSRR